MIAYFLAAYLILNGIVFLIYGVDKYKAVHNKWRIPETTLLIAAVFGVIGAFAVMRQNFCVLYKIQKENLCITVN